MGNGLTAFIGICQTLECSWADTALWPTDKHTWPCWWQNWCLGRIKPYSQVR